MDKLCRKERDRQYYLANRESIIRKNKLYAEKNKEETKKRDCWKKHRRKYGLNKEQHQYVLDNRKGNCPICGEYSEMLCVDHDHKTMKFRGLICGSCNKGLGLLQEDINIYASAIVYLVDAMYNGHKNVTHDNMCLRCEGIKKSEKDFYHGTTICRECVSDIRLNKDYEIRSMYLTRYNITLRQYQLLLDKANGKCQICKRSDEKLLIDHCHERNIVRGFLCHFCNAGIGMFRDNIENIQNAILYVQKDGVL